MSFQVPRRDHFPRPLGDNSPHTPPDPEPGPMHPTLTAYVEARERWIQTGDLADLWDMQDNVAAVPPGGGWWDEPPPRPATPVISRTAPVPAAPTHRAYMRQVAIGFALTMTALWSLLILLGVVR